MAKTYIKCDSCDNEAVIRIDKYNSETRLTMKKNDEATDYCEDCYVKHIESDSIIDYSEDNVDEYFEDDDW